VKPHNRTERRRQCQAPRFTLNYPYQSLFKTPQGQAHTGTGSSAHKGCKSKDLTPTGNRFTPTGARLTPTGNRFTPTGARFTPTGNHFTPTGARFTPTGNRFTPLS
jgi:hypothetical protein